MFSLSAIPPSHSTHIPVAPRIKANLPAPLYRTYPNVQSMHHHFNHMPMLSRLVTLQPPFRTIHSSIHQWAESYPVIPVLGPLLLWPLLLYPVGHTYLLHRHPNLQQRRPAHTVVPWPTNLTVWYTIMIRRSYNKLQ